MIKTLIVEDDPMVAGINEQYVNRVPGFQCSGIARYVDEAIEILKNTKIDLILLDIFMLKKSGFELMRHLREHDITADVIFITAARDMESIERAMRFGAVDYLIKPFTFERFQEALANYRKQVQVICTGGDVNQEVLDTLLLNKQEIRKKHLPRGLTKRTFEKVWEQILLFKGSPFTADDLDKNMELSRVSIGKYLHFFEDEGLVSVEVEYGAVGRPVTKYQVGASMENAVEIYV